jgi:hypothetical protein
MGRPRVTQVHPVDDLNQVVSVVGGHGGYRRSPCGGPPGTVGGCPWRVDQTGSFPADAFAVSARTAHDMSGHTFGCHESGTDRPVICAGFLLRGADHNMAVRMKVASGEIDLFSVSDGGHELHDGYVTMATKNGTPEYDLHGCRYSRREEMAGVIR